MEWQKYIPLFLSLLMLTAIFLFIRSVFRKIARFFKPKPRPKPGRTINIEMIDHSPKRRSLEEEKEEIDWERVGETKARLDEAIDDGEIIVIRYRGGSQPGKTRQIAPKSIKGLICSAYCYSTEEVLSFRIDKLFVLKSDSPVTYQKDN